MQKKIAVPASAIESDWTVTTEYTVQRNAYTKTLSPGTEISIVGERGRFRFMKHVARPDGTEWIDVWGSPKGAECTRSFRPNRIKTVHTKGKTDKALIAERKAAIKAAREAAEQHV